MLFIYSLREKLELLGLLYFAIFFLLSPPPSLSCKERVRKKFPHMPPACVCSASLICAPQCPHPLSSVPPKLFPQCLSASPVAPGQESSDPSPLRCESTRALRCHCLCCSRVRPRLCAWHVLLPCLCHLLHGNGGISWFGGWLRPRMDVKGWCLLPWATFSKQCLSKQSSADPSSG